MITLFLAPAVGAVRRIPWQVWAAVALLGLGFLGGWRTKTIFSDHAKARVEAAHKKELAEINETQRKALEAVDRERMRVVGEAEELVRAANREALAAKTRVETRFVEVRRDIPYQIPPGLDSHYPVPNGLVCVVNAAVRAAGGCDPAASRSPVGAGDIDIPPGTASGDR